MSLLPCTTRPGFGGRGRRTGREWEGKWKAKYFELHLCMYIFCPISPTSTRYASTIISLMLRQLAITPLFSRDSCFTVHYIYPPPLPSSPISPPPLHPFFLLHPLRHQMSFTDCVWRLVGELWRLLCRTIILWMDGSHNHTKICHYTTRVWLVGEECSLGRRRSKEEKTWGGRKRGAKREWGWRAKKRNGVRVNAPSSSQGCLQVMLFWRWMVRE